MRRQRCVRLSRAATRVLRCLGLGSIQEWPDAAPAVWRLLRPARRALHANRGVALLIERTEQLVGGEGLVEVDSAESADEADSEMNDEHLGHFDEAVLAVLLEKRASRERAAEQRQSLLREEFQARKAVDDAAAALELAAIAKITEADIAAREAVREQHFQQSLVRYISSHPHSLLHHLHLHHPLVLVLAVRTHFFNVELEF